MSIRSVIPSLAALAVAGALVLTGCGSPTVNQASLLHDFGNTSTSTEASTEAGAALPGAGTFSSDCIEVASAYASIALALLPSIGGGAGSGTYDSSDITKAIGTLGGSVPPQLKGDFQTLGDAAKSASGKSLADAGQVLSSPAVSAASDDIDKWMTANCGG